MLTVQGARHAQRDLLPPLSPRSPPGDACGGLSPVMTPSAEPLTDEALEQLHEQFLAQQAWALGSPTDDVDSMLQQMLDSSVHAAPVKVAAVAAGGGAEGVAVGGSDDSDDGVGMGGDDAGVPGQRMQGAPTPTGFAALLHARSQQSKPPEGYPLLPDDAPVHSPPQALPGDQHDVTEPACTPARTLPAMDDATLDAFVAGLAGDADIDQLLAGV